MRKQQKPLDVVQGIELIEQVIDHVQKTGYLGAHQIEKPLPVSANILDALTFPSGKPLSPSLKRWLAFDSSWLTRFGWFDTEGHFIPRQLDEIVQAEFGAFGRFYEQLAAQTGECFLLPEGSDTCRIFAVTQQDSFGEYPVLVADIDDGAFLGIEYPGFDVYMADFPDTEIHACDWDAYQTLFRDPRYTGRMRQHARKLFQGRHGLAFA